MNLSKFIFSALLLTTAFVSCKKDKDDAPKNAAIEGKWVGTYLNKASETEFFYSFNIKPGGIIEELDNSGAKIGEGTWKLENNIFTARYYWPGGGNGFSVLAAFYPNDAQLLGDWGYGTSTTNGGVWEMKKVN
jgi:hypothetical protein